MLKLHFETSKTEQAAFQLGAYHRKCSSGSPLVPAHTATCPAVSHSQGLADQSSKQVSDYLWGMWLDEPELHLRWYRDIGARSSDSRTWSEGQKVPKSWCQDHNL
jgi:hypothetical protein